ncbi:MAG: UMP kinase [Clostridia bacterium]|nr:UMP kinase [Clostridia bacterium]
MELKYKRVLLKMSGEVLSSEKAPVDSDKVAEAAKHIKVLHDAGVQVGVVVGGGNIMRGRDSGSMDRNRADAMGMLATAINALSLEQALIDIGVPVRVLSAVSIELFMDTYSARLANNSLDNGEVVVFACGSGLPFFSTDTASALRAAQIHADAMLLAKNVDGVYSADPKKDPTAVKYDKLTYDEVISRQLRATDLTAITLCRETCMPIVVFSMEDDSAFLKAAAGENVGTVIS